MAYQALVAHLMACIAIFFAGSTALIFVVGYIVARIENRRANTD